MRITIEEPKNNYLPNVRKGFDWDKYINRQRYLECQVVSAINAYYYLTGTAIDFGSPRYNYLLDIAEANTEPARFIDLVHKELGLKIKTTYEAIADFSTVEYPLEKTIGMHSILLIDYKKDCVRITNVGQKDGWVKISDFLKFSKGLDENYFRYKLLCLN